MGRRSKDAFCERWVEHWMHDRTVLCDAGKNQAVFELCDGGLRFFALFGEGCPRGVRVGRRIRNIFGESFDQDGNEVTVGGGGVCGRGRGGWLGRE